jgi:hypothetical protein
MYFREVQEGDTLPTDIFLSIAGSTKARNAAKEMLVSGTTEAIIGTVWSLLRKLTSAYD